MFITKLPALHYVLFLGSSLKQNLDFGDKILRAARKDHPRPFKIDFPLRKLKSALILIKMVNYYLIRTADGFIGALMDCGYSFAAY